MQQPLDGFVTKECVAQAAAAPATVSQSWAVTRWLNAPKLTLLAGAYIGLLIAWTVRIIFWDVKYF